MKLEHRLRAGKQRCADIETMSQMNTETLPELYSRALNKDPVTGRLPCEVTHRLCVYLYTDGKYAHKKMIHIICHQGNKNQINNNTCDITVRMVKIQSLDYSKCL